jgi:hypothetical protein
MKDIVCNYAPVRFLPYRESGEFANVGVVMHCPQTDFFTYRLVPLRQTRRVTDFFPELEPKFFQAALRGIERELERIQSAHHPLPNNQEVPAEIAKEQVTRFRELVRRREGLLHFGEAGAFLADAPEVAIDQLYGRFVDRQFARRKDYQEIVMRKRLEQFLSEWKLSRHYAKNRKVGDDDFHVVMPFVHYTEGIAAKALKPLDLNKPETSDIYHHGGAWVKNMERLRTRKTMPREVIFTVMLPEDGKRFKAANEICDELKKVGVEPVRFEDLRHLHDAVALDFAA